MKKWSPALREIERLDPQTEHQQILFLSLCYDFPIDAGVLSILILLRSFSSARIAKLIDGTGVWNRNGPQRAASLVYSLAQLVGKGYDSASGRATIARMNAVHREYAIINEDFIYLLSSFFFDPIEWNGRFGWRPFCEQETHALFYFWQEVGLRMHIRDVPQSLAGLKQFMLDYEHEWCRPTEANHRLYVALREVLAGWLPSFLRPLFRRTFPCVLDARLRRSLMITPPSRFLEMLTVAGLKGRSRLAQWLPSRRQPYPLRDRPPFYYGSGGALLPRFPLLHRKGDGARPAESADLPTPPRRPLVLPALERPNS